LLVVVTIIGMLASIALAALSQARGTARVAKTKSTIAKLNDAVIARYAAYSTRRVPVKTSGSPTAVARKRLAAIRQLMRLEMPERESDITGGTSGDPDFLSNDPNDPVEIWNWDGTSSLGTMSRPALSRAYLRRLTDNPPNPSNSTYMSAELLYLIVTLGDPEARDKFMSNEIGDADGDGWPEFVDGWGNPIYFLRWAPGFNDSDVQPNVISSSDLSSGSSISDIWKSASVLTARQEAAQNDHDPFDSRKIDMSADPTDADDPPRGWRLIPFICSAGPDGIYDISFTVTVQDSGGNDVAYTYRGNPCRSAIGIPQDTDNTSVTAPGDSNGSLDHYDNIHNHRIEAD